MQPLGWLKVFSREVSGRTERQFPLSRRGPMRLMSLEKQRVNDNTITEREWQPPSPSHYH